MTQEALKLALEALETPWNAPYVDGCDLALGKRVKAITVIKQALAETQYWDEKYKLLVQEVQEHPPQRTEQNFCSRCGKRTADLTTIHTCTPPQENT